MAWHASTEYGPPRLPSAFNLGHGPTRQAEPEVLRAAGAAES